MAHAEFRTLTVRQVRIRKAQYRHAEGRYKSHAVNVVVWDPALNDERPVQFHVFGTRKENPGPLGWLRWTDERMDLVRATAPETITVRVEKDFRRPGAAWLYMSRHSQNDWIARIKAAVASPAAAIEEEVVDESEIARDAAVITVQATFAWAAEELIVSH